MFCYQCQEAAKGTGCVVAGVCGKTPEVSNLQDLLLFVVKGVSIFSSELRKKGISHKETDRYIFDSVFTTITNANFDSKAIQHKISEGLVLRDSLKEQAEQQNLLNNLQAHSSATWVGYTLEEYENQAKKISILSEHNEDIRSLKELLTYGVKGMAAYAEHALNLGFEDSNIIEFTEKALLATIQPTITADELFGLVVECGKHGVDVMALLDKANTSSFGNPEITEVEIGVRNNPGILVSGHDLKDLEELLIQSENSGIDIYTHSEMLPAHYYPAFKKFKHFAGNYGSSWWNQASEFSTFNGPILFTTNCIVPPKSNANYIKKVFTTGASGCDGFKHIADRKAGQMKDFSEIIKLAKTCNPPTEIEKGKIIGGFAHQQVLALADKVVGAVKSGAIKNFVVMAGCDGRMNSRSYYTEFAQNLPQDSVILTAGCAKYRYNKLKLGDIGGIPRVLDAGQCNDSYSLAVIALKLKEVFGLENINDLPIVYNIAWYEQKAVIVLLALLYLGVKKINLGPTLPAFLSPNVVKILVEKFGIGGITDVETDLNKMIIKKETVV